ncbi:MAG: YqjF family protein [Gaiellaceae bacterium]
MGQTWEQTFWAHWPVPVADLRARVPDELEIEEHDGTAWLGIVFFRVRALRARGALPLPGISSFLQLNVRTYVRGPDGLPGVWFFSIDASSRLAALGVRRLYRVPAFHARMTLESVEDSQEAECARIGESGRVFSGRYRANGESFQPKPGSLEAFLTERYRLFTRDGSAEMHHDRWHLTAAEAEIELATIAPFALGGAPRCHFSFRQDALIWPPEPVRS